MKFRQAKLHEINQTGYEGDLNISLEAIENVFGKPTSYDDGKTTHEWWLRFADGTIATVYDYKGDRWHIGGFSYKAVERVYEALGLVPEGD